MLAHGLGRDQVRKDQQGAKANRKDGGDGKSKAFDAGGHGTEFPVSGVGKQGTIASEGVIRQDVMSLVNDYVIDSTLCHVNATRDLSPVRTP